MGREGGLAVVEKRGSWLTSCLFVLPLSGGGVYPSTKCMRDIRRPGKDGEDKVD